MSDRDTIDREETFVKAFIQISVIDDGWNLPKEQIEELEYRIKKTMKQRRLELEELRKQHVGEWLTEKVAYEYSTKAWIYRVQKDNQYAGMVRTLGEELQERHGVTELEATNIVLGNESNIRDYVNRYESMRSGILSDDMMQGICVSVSDQYLYSHIA